MNAALCIALAIAPLLASAGPAVATKNVLEMSTKSLLVRIVDVRHTSEKLERLTYSIKNIAPVPVYVTLESQDISMGLCSKFISSSLPMRKFVETGNGRWRLGRLLRPGEETTEHLIASPECPREDHVVHFIGYFLVGYEPGWIRPENFALGNIYFQTR